MASQNNAHIPDDLLNAMSVAAEAEGRTADDLLAEAARQFLEHKELDALALRGRGHVERFGRPDPVKAVRDIRRGR
jgi:hypothetical protein